MEAKKETITMIPVAAIKPSPVNKRNPKEMDIESLSADIIAHGLINAIHVRQDPADSGKYELVAGERRWLAFESLQRDEIPAIVRNLTDKEAYAITLAENLQRKDLTPWEEASSLQALVDLGATLEEIAAQTGWPVSKVARRARLLKLSENWKKAMTGANAKKVDIGALELVARLDKETQDDILKNKCQWRDTITTNDINHIMDDYMLTLSAAPWSLKDDNGLVIGSGNCAACQKRTGCQPDLFGDDNGKKVADKCLDPECFAKKKAAFLEMKVKTLRESDPGVVLLTHEYGQHKGNDLAKEAVHHYEVETVTKKTPGARMALHVDGPDAGKTVYIKMDKKLEKKAGGEKVGVSMKEKRVALESKRWCLAIGKLQEAINGMKSVALRIEQVISLAVIFGTSESKRWPQSKDWKSYPTMAKASGLAFHLFCMVRPVLIQRLSYGGGVTQLGKDYIEEAKTVAGVLGLDVDAMYKEAVKEIPEPKSWSAEKATAPAKGKKEPKERACRACGCTNGTPCLDDGGSSCGWIEKDLCSACADKAKPKKAKVK